MALAAAMAYDDKLFEPAEEAPPLSRLPVVSLIAITLLVAIPAIDEISRRLFDVSPATESLRTRLALAMMIPFGIVVVVREFLSRRALIRAGQELVDDARAARAEREAGRRRPAGVGRGPRAEQSAAGRARLRRADAGGTARRRSRPKSCAPSATTPIAPPASSATC